MLAVKPSSTNNRDPRIKPVNNEEDDEEGKHFQRIVKAFRYYRVHSLKRVTNAVKHYTDLPARHKEMIPKHKDHLMQVQTCILHNYEIIKLIIQNSDHMFENKDHGPDEETPGSAPASEFDMDKVKSTLKQFSRDWSTDGEAERKACYGPVLEELLSLFPPNKCNPSDVSILVPGAGLGRLTHEIARLGYNCQGNEFSLFMLFASNFILNRCKEENAYTIYPWVHQYCNNHTANDQLRPVAFPDVNPRDLPPNADFSMAAGDFLEVYTDPDQWDCVATVFFMDTAHNIMQYMETIYKILKPGGYWINFGPLLYHFADMANEASIELTYEELREVIKQMKFIIVKEQENMPASYAQQSTSMLQYVYRCVFFVCQKPWSAEEINA